MKRRTTPVEPPAQPVLVTPPAKPVGKGRPTPKRSEGQGKRRIAVKAPPTDRKEASRRTRDAAKEARLRQRLAMETSDAKNYPAMHAGKERALVRDVVDARRSIAWFGMPTAFVLFMSASFLNARGNPVGNMFNGALLVLMVAVFADAALAYRRVTKVLRERFPTGTREKTSTLALYGIARNNQIPARRKPKPLVKRGGTY